MKKLKRGQNVKINLNNVKNNKNASQNVENVRTNEKRLQNIRKWVKGIGVKWTKIDIKGCKRLQEPLKALKR